ncbi:tetratricopeptide repeat protein [Pontixanthobacter aquaemixtae]|uniref:Tetratricopeptide repeat protein n=1 Tax=Pontixanthobacter aquaemixtae TaxID=1958940 RepID=A0A844ZQQ4_9SPHN|nr:tetratricopeptide repeat protein [Pontixanthobacter aquaemixtae]MXO89864.1 hypothetical protein [Pontixanthobacter aquaemixtae]
MVPSASAETLPVAGIYPAQSDAAAAVNTIAVDNFGGDKGASLSFAITDALEAAVIEGEPYFRLYPTRGDDVDAVLRGAAGLEVVETELEAKKVTKCEERDDDRKCIREKVRFYDCYEIAVSVMPDVRLIARDGAELYSMRDRVTNKERHCTDDYSAPSVDTMAQNLVEQYAGRVRYAFAPFHRNEQIRILESRKGLSREDGRAFRNAVRLTKSDIHASCEAFSALEAANPQHVSVLFNVGLCAEGQGELETAKAYYRRALEVEPGKEYPISGLRRIADRYRADRQLAAHYEE